MKRLLWSSLVAVALLAVSQSQRAAAIVGGRAISIRQAPWAVSILNTADRRDGAWCSGVVVDAEHVLTAAHCVYDLSTETPLPVGDLRVVAGEANVGGPAKGDEPQSRGVVVARPHPFYRVTDQLAYRGLLPDDVAVLTLAKPLNLSTPDVKAVALRAAGPFPAGRSAVIAAFGGVSANGRDGVLHAMTATVLAQGRCGLGDGDQDLAPFTGVELCSQATGGSCPGDSGAGIVALGKSPTLIGILNSAPGGDCKKGIPTRFAYVGTGEIREWVLYGDAHPPVAPRDFSLIINGIPLRVGAFIVCGNIGTRSYQARYVLSVAGRVIRTSGGLIQYRVPRVDAGEEMRCVGTATNAGGTAFDSWTLRVAP